MNKRNTPSRTIQLYQSSIAFFRAYWLAPLARFSGSCLSLQSKARSENPFGTYRWAFPVVRISLLFLPFIDSFSIFP